MVDPDGGSLSYSASLADGNSLADGQPVEEAHTYLCEKVLYIIARSL